MAASSGAATTIASSPAGEFRGLCVDGVKQYVGIRYAQPPVGPLRFRAPQAVPAATAPVAATTYGGRNFQVGMVEDIYAGLELPGDESEDCLFLNVFAPADTQTPAPVMVWLHGGAFTSGSGNEYDPANIVRHNHVIVVTVNYRLGVFGFLNLQQLGSCYEGSANLGIQDQIAALGWVQENIAAFGGDPANVTIWGESAGAGSVLALLGAPAAAGLFHKAIVFSGGE
ncbi:MAG: carboxylesterase family protein, partial [Pseudomonadota bacterium]